MPRPRAEAIHIVKARWTRRGQDGARWPSSPAAERVSSRRVHLESIGPGGMAALTNQEEPDEHSHPVAFPPRRHGASVSVSDPRPCPAGRRRRRGRFRPARAFRAARRASPAAAARSKALEPPERPQGPLQPALWALGKLSKHPTSIILLRDVVAVVGDLDQARVASRG